MTVLGTALLCIFMGVGLATGQHFVTVLAGFGIVWGFFTLLTED